MRCDNLWIRLTQMECATTSSAQLHVHVSSSAGRYADDLYDPLMRRESRVTLLDKVQVESSH